MSKKTDQNCQIFTELLGNLFREKRSAASISQQKLSDEIDVSRTTIGKWENGKTRPDIYEFYKALQKIDPNFTFFWQNLKQKLDAIFTPQELAAEKEKFRRYMEQSKIKRLGKSPSSSSKL